MARSLRRASRAHRGVDARNRRARSSRMLGRGDRALARSTADVETVGAVRRRRRSYPRTAQGVVVSTLGVIGFVLLGFVVGLASGFRLAIIRYRHIHRALVQNIYGVR